MVMVTWNTLAVIARQPGLGKELGQCCSVVGKVVGVVSGGLFWGFVVFLLLFLL